MIFTHTSDGTTAAATTTSFGSYSEIPTLQYKMGTGVNSFAGWDGNNEALFVIELAVDLLVAGGTYFRFSLTTTLTIKNPCRNPSNLQYDANFPTARGRYHHPYTKTSRPVFFEYQDWQEDGTNKPKQYVYPYLNTKIIMKNKELGGEVIPAEACNDDLSDLTHFKWRNTGNQKYTTESEFNDLRRFDKVSWTTYYSTVDNCIWDTKVSSVAIDYFSFMCGHKDSFPTADWYTKSGVD